MAVSVTRIIASRGLMMVGSGTFSTRILWMPSQHNAFMVSPVYLLAARCYSLLTAPGRLALGRRNLACFHDLLEVAQIFSYLRIGVLAEHLCHQLASLPCRWGVFKHHFDDGAAPAWCGCEVDRTCVIDVGVAHRAPRDELVLFFVDDLCVPGDGAACRGIRGPVGVCQVLHRHGLQVLHKARQVLKVAPETIEFRWRF